MQITLLPPILSTQSPVAVPAVGLPLAPGMKVLATVLGTTADGGALLSLFGRHVPSNGPLPHPVGTTLHLEVVEGGERPLLRLVGTAAGTQGATTGTAATSAAPGIGLPAAVPAPTAALSPVTYGLAAAVLAARAGTDVRAAAVSLATWVPLLVTAGVLSRSQGDALMRALTPVPVPLPSPDAPDARAATEAVARAIKERVDDGGVLMERRLADVLRHPGTAAERAAANDLRARLAVLAHVLEKAPTPLPGARTAVTDLQAALLGEQARAAAHLARDGVVDVRVPLQVAGHDAEMRLRMRIARDAPDAHHADPAPWRHVRLDLNLPRIGRVQVLIGLAAAQVQAEFVVERAEVADLIEEGLVQLGTSMQAAGFSQLLSRVVVDPVRVAVPDDLPELPAHRGILDARA
jgi:hypothetical protein